MSTIKSKKTKTYIDAGVNIDIGDQFVDEIKPLAKKTNTPGANASLGGFGGIFDLSKLSLKEPLLISSTDGVGTKLEIAIKMQKHNTIGIDLVAMCVNDILAEGAQPLFFLDYYATGRLDLKISKEILKGIVNGCIQAEISLIGGETAEMPGIYQQNIYDLAGFCVGAIEKKKYYSREFIKKGDIAIALSSSGIHSNGFSMVRSILKDNDISLYDADPFEKSKTIGETLLEPTKIYTKFLNKLNALNLIKRSVNITGGGLIKNPPRVFDDNLTLKINVNNWHLPKEFKWLKKMGNLSTYEMLKVFNCGIGMILLVEKDYVDEVIQYVNNGNENCFVIGEMVEKCESSVFFEGNLKKWSTME